MSQTVVETNTFVVVRVSREGAMIAANGKNQIVDWDVLRAAAEQPDKELRRIYSALLQQAEAMVCDRRPLSIEAAETNTNVYGVLGVGLDGKHRGIRCYTRLRTRNDEGLDLYRLADAKAEARDIALRNGVR